MKIGSLVKAKVRISLHHPFFEGYAIVLGKELEHNGCCLYKVFWLRKPEIYDRFSNIDGRLMEVVSE